MFEIKEPWKTSICIFCSHCDDIECKMFHQFKECFDEFYDNTHCVTCSPPACFNENPCKSAEKVV